MTTTRRNFLKSGISAALTWLTTVSGLSIFSNAHAGLLKNAFLETDTQNLLRELYPGLALVNSDRIALKIPDLAENGAIVPISVTSTLKNAESIAIIVENNPRPLAAHIRISPDAEAWLSTRIRMAETSNVLALVKAGDTLHAVRQWVTVIIGGCGT